jgi:hypothetical protein
MAASGGDGVLHASATKRTGAVTGLREMRTDRPDATESPFTVDPGHVQLEMDFANLTEDRRDGGRTREWALAPFNLRLGLTPRFELGVFAEPFDRTSTTPPGGPHETRTGYGDITLRGKWNDAGNDAGGFAWGVIADVKLPTASSGLGNGKMEGGLILPIAVSLPKGWNFGAMTAMGMHYNQRGYQGAWLNTATLGHGLTRNTSGYVELTSSVGGASHASTFDFGWTWQLDASTQLDAGVNLGIAGIAPDQQIFSGISRRF